MFPKRLRLEIIALLCAKAVLLGALYFVLVRPVERPDPGRAELIAHLTAGG